MDGWTNVIRAETGDTPARAGPTDGDTGIHHRGTQTQSGAEGMNAVSAGECAGTVRLAGTVVPPRGTGVRLSGTGVRVMCTGVRETWTGVRLKWPVVPVDGTGVRLLRTGVRPARASVKATRTVAESIAMPEQRIPRADGVFAAYANHYYEAVEKFWSVQGLDEGDLKPLKEALSAWNAAYPKHIAARNAAEAARQSKDAAKRELERQIRPISAFVQSYPKTTDADRATIGISVRDTGGPPTPAPTSRPLLLIDAGSRLTHRLRLVDESTPTRSARPRGTLGAEVYLALVPARETPPADPSVYKFIRTVTRGGAEVAFPAEQGGLNAAYLVRWVSATGEPGPWSETVTATVAA